MTSEAEITQPQQFLTKMLHALARFAVYRMGKIGPEYFNIHTPSPIIRSPPSSMKLANGVRATNWRRVKRSFCCVTPYACDARTREPDEGDPEHRVSRTCLARSLSSGSAAADRQDDVPGLLLRFDVPGRLDHVLQRVAPIDDRPVSPGLDEFLEEEDVLLRVASYPERHPLVSDPPGHQDQYRNMPQEPKVGFDVEPAGLQ